MRAPPSVTNGCAKAAKGRARARGDQPSDLCLTVRHSYVAPTRAGISRSSRNDTFSIFIENLALVPVTKPSHDPDLFRENS